MFSILEDKLDHFSCFAAGQIIFFYIKKNAQVLLMCFLIGKKKLNYMRINII
jgi:hypothetical protein